MNKTEKIKYIIETLELLFPEVPIPLDHKDPYTLLIAVLLSAQSTDVGVNKITPIHIKNNNHEIITAQCKLNKRCINNIQVIINQMYQDFLFICHFFCDGHDRTIQSVHEI